MWGMAEFPSRSGQSPAMKRFRCIPRWKTGSHEWWQRCWKGLQTTSFDYKSQVDETFAGVGHPNLKKNYSSLIIHDLLLNLVTNLLPVVTWLTQSVMNHLLTKLSPDNGHFQIKLENLSFQLVQPHLLNNCVLHPHSDRRECTSNVSVLYCIHYQLSWVEQGLTSHQTHYRSYWGRVLTGQMIQPTMSKHWRKTQD